MTTQDTLSARGRRARRIIVDFLVARGLDGSLRPGEVFYSPAQWAERGEEYGLRSVLIVTYDGGDHRRAMTLDAYDYATVEALGAELAREGFYLEECCTWYGAVYER